MTMKKRILSLLLALVMVLSVMTVAAMAKGVQTFADVKESDWFYDAVCYVTDNGLMNGTGSGFAPQQTTSRAMLWAVLSRVDGQNAKRNANDWYAAAQLWAIQHDISDGTAPEAPITREQLAAMLYRYAQRKGLVRAAAYADLSGFADAASVSAYADEAMQWAVANGILTGMDGKLCPQGNATRAQVAQILYRLCETWNLLPADNTAAIASAIYFAENPEHTHVWGEAKPNGNGTHTSTCACGETKTEYCTLIHQTGSSWKCSACGFVVEGTTDAGVSTWEELEEAVENGKSPIYLAADIAVKELITFTGDTTIYGTGHKLTIAEGVTLPRMLEAGSHKLTLNGLTLDGENKTCEDYKGIINAGKGSTLTLEEVTIQNFNAYRILRTIEADEASLTNVTIKDNALKSYNPKDLSCVLLLNSTPKAKMKNVTITGNQTDRILIYLVGTTNLEAEELTVEDNKVGTHLVTTKSTSNANTYTFTSGSIKHNTDGGQGFFVVSNITIGRDMLVECNITINSVEGGGTCTLTNNGTIIGNIQTAFPNRGLPNYTGSGTHTGTKTDIHDLTVKP